MNSLIARLLRPRPTVQRVFPIAFLLVLYLMPQLYGSGSVRLAQYELVLSFIMVGLALDIAMSYAGQFVIGITSVFAVGAYAAGLVVKHHPSGVGLVPMMLIGGVVGAVGGLVIGLPALRVGGFYLALVSLYAALAIPSVADNTKSLGGLTGLTIYIYPGFAPKLSGEKLYLIVLTIVLATSLLSWALLTSRIGRRFLALRASDHLSISIGIAGYRTKLLALFLSSVLAGIAGSIYLYTQQFIGPTSATPDTAILILAALVIGGAGTTFGPLLGGLLVLGFNQFSTAFPSYDGIVFGALLLACAVFLPDGLVERLNTLAVRAGLKQRAHARPDRASARPPIPSAPAEARPAGPAQATRTDLTPVLDAGRSAPLVVDRVRRTFGGVTAVDDVDLVVRPGTVHGLIGSNGSGKTTLLNLISGFYKVDSGRIALGDVDLTRRPAYERARVGIARTFQSPKLMLERSTIDNIVVAIELRLRCWGALSVLRVGKGLHTNRRAYAEAGEMLERLGIADLRNVAAGELPHGTRRLVELGRVIAMRPSFVLLDEPAAGLSPTELELLSESMQAMAEAGTGVLLIEHNVPMVLDLADEITVLHQGHRLSHGTPAELRANQQVASAFLGIDLESERGANAVEAG